MFQPQRETRALSPKISFLFTEMSFLSSSPHDFQFIAHLLTSKAALATILAALVKKPVLVIEALKHTTKQV